MESIQIEESPPLNSEPPSKKTKVDEESSSQPTSSSSSASQNDVTFRVITNDGTDSNSEDLTALKNIISRQLPKMPKEYIVRLVFDRRHISMVICRNGVIIGGICYRPYLEQRFGEIAFCAISGSEQVRGYGTRLMNNLKNYVQKEKLEYFLTYADNYAIGYFQKQGFSKTVVMPKERWVGYIKDYDGGTLMECYIHPAMDFLNVPAIVAKQRDFIYRVLQERSKSGTVYPGLELFKEGRRLASALEVPGVVEAGWTQQHIFRGTTERDRHSAQSRLSYQLKLWLEKIRVNANAWPFLDAVNAAEIPEYSLIIKNPMDLHTITLRLKEGDYYRSKEAMYADLCLMINNCKVFNDEGSEYYQCAVNLEKVIVELFTAKDTPLSQVVESSV